MNFKSHSQSLFLVFLSLCIVLAACAGFGAFSFTEESDVIVVEADINPLSGLLPTRIPLDVDLEQELQEQDANGAKAVYLTGIYFEMIDDSEHRNFGSFIDDITISVSSESHDSREIAWREPVPDGDRFELNVDDDFDLKPMAEEGIRFRTQASGSAPADDAKFKVYATFRVNVL